MKRFLAAAAGLALALSTAGCLLEEPLTAGTPEAPEVVAAPLPRALNMADTLAATAPVASLTGTWFVRQVNKDGGLFLGSASFLQVGRLLIGRIDWQNHPDGHLIGWVSKDVTAFGQGFTDTSKANLLGFYAARITAGGDSLVQGTTYSNGNDSGTWVAARVSDCPALQLTPTPLPCQVLVDPFPGPDSLPVPGPGVPPDSDTVAVAPDPLAPLTGCWAVDQVNINGSSYRGTLVLAVEGDTVTGSALWAGHPAGTIKGTVGLQEPSNLPSPPPHPRQHLVMVLSYAGAKADLKGHYDATLLADGTLSGSTYATEGGVANGDSATWVATRTACSGPL